MTRVLDRLRGGLIVSVQAKAPSLLADSYVLAAMAAEAERAGAIALRMEGIENILAARKRTTVPMIGLIKRDYAGFEPYITPTLAEVEALLACGVEVVAFDATSRTRPGGATVEAIVAAIHAGGSCAMGDCSEAGDADRAAAAGADFVGSTLCGYTKETAGAALPALDLVRAMAKTGAFPICEGGIHNPAEAAAALAAGAEAVVVGTAISDLGWLVGEFAAAVAKRTPG